MFVERVEGLAENDGGELRERLYGHLMNSTGNFTETGAY